MKRFLALFILVPIVLARAGADTVRAIWREL
jgi:hypothetical protein